VVPWRAWFHGGAAPDVPPEERVVAIAAGSQAAGDGLSTLPATPQDTKAMLDTVPRVGELEEGVVPDEWEHLRARFPAIPPPDVLQEQSSPNWRDSSAATVNEFSFACAAVMDTEKLWHFYRQCAYADIFVDVLYKNTRWAWKINAYHGGGTPSVPSLRVEKGTGFSMNWWITSDGRIRVDGKTATVDAAKPGLRRALQRYDPGNSEHTKFTGRGTHARAKTGRTSAEECARRARAERVKGRVLALKQGQVFDPAGEAGIWDIIEKHAGARNLPKAQTTPWTVVARTGVLVSIYPDGRIKATTTTALTADLETLEDILVRVAGAQWIGESTALEAARQPGCRISYGEQGQRAKDRLQHHSL
jgi:hypothetical protein